MIAAKSTRKARAVAATLACVLAVVGLAAGCASLSVTLISAEHACCHTEKVDPPCLTLCAASQTDAVLAAELVASLDSTALALNAGPRSAPPARPAVAPSAVLEPDSSPPLYLRHAALLI